MDRSSKPASGLWTVDNGHFELIANGVVVADIDEATGLLQIAGGSSTLTLDEVLSTASSASDATVTSALVTAAANAATQILATQAYAPGSFSVTTAHFRQMSSRLQLTTTQRATLAGTGRLEISGATSTQTTVTDIRTTANASAAALVTNVAYAPGSFTVATETFRLISRHLKLTMAQRATLVGTATLRIS